MTSFVRDAAEYAPSTGVEEASTSFNNPTGPYVLGNSYIFGYDMNGTTLAFPYQPEVIGTDRMNYTDMYGAQVTAQEIDAARGEMDMYMSSISILIRQ